VHDVSLHYTGRGKGGKGDAAEAAPPDIVIQEIDSQELNRVFVRRFPLLSFTCSDLSCGPDCTALPQSVDSLAGKM